MSFFSEKNNVQVNQLTSQLAQKVKSTNIQEIRDNSNAFEYSLDGITWKQVQGGGSGGSPANQLKDLTGFFQRHNKNVVITGDSLGHNWYSYGSTPRTNAYDSFPGTLNWSFMLRDAIHRNDPWFVDAEHLRLAGDTLKILNGNSVTMWFPFNGIVVQGSSGLPTRELKLYYRHKNPNNKAVLYMTKVKGNTACSFDVYVDGVLKSSAVNNYSDATKWQGYDPMAVVVDCPGDDAWHEIKLTNFQGTHPTPDAALRDVYIHGIGSKLTNINLTSIGSQQSSYFVTNLAERITSYNPDLVIMIIGANDIALGTTVTAFKDNLRSIANGIRSVKADCNILFLSPTDMSDPANPESTTNPYQPLSKIKTYVQAMSDVCAEKNCMFMNLVDLFSNIPKADWRHDNVHLTKYGNKILCDNVLGNIVRNGVYPKDLVDTSKEYLSFSRREKHLEHGSIKAVWNVTNSAFTITGNTLGDVISVTKLNAYSVRVQFRGAVSPNPYGPYFAIICPRAEQLFGGSVNYWIKPNATFGPDYFDFYIIKPDGTLPGDAAWNATDMQFIISW